MRTPDIKTDEVYVAQYPGNEANHGYGTGYPLVRATALATRQTIGGGFREPKVNGVRLRLEERLRVRVRYDISADVEWIERPVGHEFVVEARYVEPLDDQAVERTDARERRYAEQDAVMEALGRLDGPAVTLRGDSVILDRSDAVAWLMRLADERVETQTS